MGYGMPDKKGSKFSAKEVAAAVAAVRQNPGLGISGEDDLGTVGYSKKGEAHRHLVQFFVTGSVDVHTVTHKDIWKQHPECMVLKENSFRAAVNELKKQFNTREAVEAMKKGMFWFV